jgi:Fic family protein
MTAVGSRSGRFVKQPQGYRAFIPASLPPEPPIHLDWALASLLADAQLAVGRLDGSTQILPDPDMFVAMYVRREAVLSSQIEGTQSSLDDVLAFELDPKSRDLPADVTEVVNYVKAMNHGLERLKTFPLSLRLIREIHAELLRDVRGSEKQPGEFRTSQNWIGAGNVSIARATFVPPPPEAMREALANLELYLHRDMETPVLIHCGIIHAQFETIHPFLDGNGRVGRLLITLLLCHRGVLRLPLLYLSHYLKTYRAEYYDRLMATRLQGDWEGWIRFFLSGVIQTAEEATLLARSIIDMRDNHRNMIESRKLSVNSLRLLDILFRYPMIDVNFARDNLRTSFHTASKLVQNLEELGILSEITGRQRDRRYLYIPYLDLFREAEEGSMIEPMQETLDETDLQEGDGS